MIVNQFLNSLRKKKFAIPYCTKCTLPAWPPVENCYYCMSRVILKEIRAPVGRLFEYTTAYNMSRPMKFGVVGIRGIRVIGYLDSTVPPCVGIEVIMKSCGITSDGTPFYEFRKYEREGKDHKKSPSRSLTSGQLLGE